MAGVEDTAEMSKYFDESELRYTHADSTVLKFTEEECKHENINGEKTTWGEYDKSLPYMMEKAR